MMTYAVLFIVDAARSMDEEVIHIIHQLETNLAQVRRQLKMDKHAPSLEDDDSESGQEADAIEKPEEGGEEGKQETEQGEGVERDDSVHGSAIGNADVPLTMTRALSCPRSRPAAPVARRSWPAVARRLPKARPSLSGVLQGPRRPC